MDGLEDDTFDPDDTHHSVQSLSGHGCRPFARLSLSPPGQRCAVTPRIRRWQWRDARMESGSSLSMEWPLLGRQSIEMILAFSYISRVPYQDTVSAVRGRWYVRWYEGITPHNTRVRQPHTDSAQAPLNRARVTCTCRGHTPTPKPPPTRRVHTSPARATPRRWLAKPYGV